MASSDFVSVLQWWLVLFIFGIGFLPLTTLLFEKLFDKGYIFSKLLSLSIITYAIFVLGIIHLVPFAMLTGYLVFLAVAGVIFVLLPQKWKFFYTLKHSWRIFIFEEIIFFAALLTWSYIHAFQPDIHGLEKYMDFGFINSILRSTYFPPKDMWLTPFYINYYYFGHLMTAVLTKLSGLPSNIAFNSMMATIFAFCFTETFSLGTNLYTFLKNNQKIINYKRIVFGFLTALLVTLGGNLHIIYTFFKPYQNENPVPPWMLQFSPLTFLHNSYWYPNATRFIYHTIHEFPIYSWTVADLHGHVLDIPFVLLAISLLFTIFIIYDPEEEKEEYIPDEKQSLLAKKISAFAGAFTLNPFLLILNGFLLAVMYMTNAWDGAIYFLLTAFVILFIYWTKIQQYQNEAKPKQWFMAWLADFFLSMLFVIAPFIVFLLPYNTFFKPFVSGIGVICAPDFLTKIGKIGPLLFEPNHCEHSYWWELLIMYGFFYFFVFSFLILVSKTKKLFHTDMFILLLIILSTLLILIPEFIYVKDIYPTYYRANTMFKLVFQAFIMLMICSSYVILRILSPAERSNSWRRRILYPYFIFFPITLVLLGLVMLYPYMSISSYYANLTTYRGLDGTKYLQTLYPTDYNAIQWINKEIKGQPVILEAQGDSYTDYARISANTGLPTVLGWTVHEWLWRGSYDVPSNTPTNKVAEMRFYYPAPRINDVKDLYESTDLKQTKQLLRKYNVKYVFIGALEYQKYPNLDEAKFSQFGKIVFKDGTTKIYEINPL